MQLAASADIPVMHWLEFLAQATTQQHNNTTTQQHNNTKTQQHTGLKTLDVS
jgi:hypothetical protein